MKPISFILPLILIANFFFSCSKEIPLNEENLIGTWHNTMILEQDERISQLQYHFQNDNSLEIIRRELDIDNQAILGYSYRALASFELTDSLIYINYNDIYFKYDAQGDFTELDKLNHVQAGPNDFTAYVCRFEDEGNKLILSSPSPCGPAANCIGELIFIRE